MTLTSGPSLAWLVALLVLATTLAGCHGLGATTSEYAAGDSGVQEDLPAGPMGEDEEGVGDERNETPTPPELALALAVPEGRAFAGVALQVSVQVTGDNASADLVAVLWGREPTAGLAGAQLHADLFEGEASVDDANLSLPGNFSASWAPGQAGVYYMRAQVVANDTIYWSDEANVTVVLPVEEGEFEADHTVNLRTNLLDPCEGDDYNPDPLEIEAGEVVKWVNAASCAHSATHDAEKPLWDTGLIEANAESAYGYRFNQPGNYEVRCSEHAGMSATIVVV